MAILLLLAYLPMRPAGAADLVEGSAFVVDGDTIEIRDERVRLWSIDGRTGRSGLRLGK